jgi:hypothetical protein
VRRLGRLSSPSRSEEARRPRQGFAGASRNTVTCARRGNPDEAFARGAPLLPRAGRLSRALARRSRATPSGARLLAQGGGIHVSSVCAGRATTAPAAGRQCGGLRAGGARATARVRRSGGACSFGGYRRGEPNRVNAIRLRLVSVVLAGRAISSGCRRGQMPPFEDIARPTGSSWFGGSWEPW